MSRRRCLTGANKGIGNGSRNVVGQAYCPAALKTLEGAAFTASSEGAFLADPRVDLATAIAATRAFAPRSA